MDVMDFRRLADLQASLFDGGDDGEDGDACVITDFAGAIEEFLVIFRDSGEEVFEMEMVALLLFEIFHDGLVVVTAVLEGGDERNGLDATAESHLFDAFHNA